MTLDDSNSNYSWLTTPQLHSAAGEDYTTTSQMVTFQPTETSLIVMVPILIDIRLEGVEQFTAMLSLPAGQVGVVLGVDMATVEITDDDCEYFFSDSVG